jgi:hypothetical protein
MEEWEADSRYELILVHPETAHDMGEEDADIAKVLLNIAGERIACAADSLQKRS